MVLSIEKCRIGHGNFEVIDERKDAAMFGKIWMRNSICTLCRNEQCLIRTLQCLVGSLLPDQARSEGEFVRRTEV